MWSLGKVLDTPEVARVYVGHLPRGFREEKEAETRGEQIEFSGSFWDQPLKNEKLRELFEQEEQHMHRSLVLLAFGSDLIQLKFGRRRISTQELHSCPEVRQFAK